MAGFHMKCNTGLEWVKESKEMRYIAFGWDGLIPLPFLSQMGLWGRILDLIFTDKLLLKVTTLEL